MIALSTVWNSLRHSNAEALVAEIRALGIHALELNFSLTESFFDEVIEAAQKQKMTIQSLHNFCPLPPEDNPEHASPDFFSLASLNEDVRKKAVYYTKRTISNAQRLGAQSVVLHLGSVDGVTSMPPLMDAFRNGLKGSLEYDTLLNDVLLSRRQLQGKHIDQVLRSLDELLSFLGSNGVSLGVETRYYLSEIPSFAEIGLILEKFPDTPLCYWHDTGHARVRKNMGAEEDSDYIKAYRDRLLGIHLHDVIGVEDHLPPGKGEIKFENIIDFIGNMDIIKVLEIHYPARAEEIKESLTFIAKLFNIV